jgi:hypothetical protein
VKAALAIMLAALAMGALRSVAWPVHTTVHYPEWLPVVIVVVSCAFNGGILLAVALRQRWAAIVYGVLLILAAPVILLHVIVGGSVVARLSYLAFAVAEIMAACLLLLTRSAREWFAAGRPDKRFPPRWHPDPAGRHQYRYWDGTSWTADVSDYGAQTIDPLPPVVPDT